jgi:hypothetical protein
MSLLSSDDSDNPLLCAMAANRCFFSVVIRAATIALAAMMVIVNKLTPVGYPANQHETPHDSHIPFTCRCWRFRGLSWRFRGLAGG